MFLWLAGRGHVTLSKLPNGQKILVGEPGKGLERSRAAAETTKVIISPWMLSSTLDIEDESVYVNGSIRML